MSSHMLVVILLLVSLLHLLLPAFTYAEASTTQEMLLMEDKIRLGSTPPSCHNRCNECNPCMAVQVPTMPGKDQAQLGRKVVVSPMDGGGLSYRSYPNYKPLGWKCRCGNQLFNP